jgi:hypothetical protein
LSKNWAKFSIAAIRKEVARGTRPDARLGLKVTKFDEEARLAEEQGS